MIDIAPAKNKKSRLEKSAFTLVEVITVLLVISLGMVGTLSLISQNIQSQSLNEKTLIAYQLAQEGVEMIRCVRDTNWINGDDWRTSMASNEYYYMDYANSAPTIAPTTADGNLSQDIDGMYYSTPGIAGSGFSRVISINGEPESEEMSVIVNVYWTDHGRNSTYSLETKLYDWK